MICNKCGTNCADNEKFCHVCGNNLINTQTFNINYQNQVNNGNQYQQPVYQNNINTGNKDNGISNKILYMISGVIIVATVIVTILIVNSGNNNVYIDETKRIDEETPTIKNNGVTAIKTDNIYYLNIADEVEAKKKISEDSTSQKGTCDKKIIEIEERIIKNYGITAVNLCEMDVSFAKEVENVIKTIYNKYPQARGYLTNLSLINTTMTENYIACFMPIFQFIFPANGNTYPITNKTQIFLNSAYFLNSKYLSDSMKDASLRGHFPKNTTRSSSVAHEFGHYLSFITMLKKYGVTDILTMTESNMPTIYKIANDFSKGENSLSIITEAYNNYKSKYNSTESLDEFRASISSYAVAKDNEGNYIYDETIAESFHDVYLNKDKAAKASIEVIAVLNERLK